MLLAFGVAYAASGDAVEGVLLVFVGGFILLAVARRALLRRHAGRVDVLLASLLFAGFGGIGVEGAIEGRVLSALAGIVWLSFAAFFAIGWWRARVPSDG